MSNNVKALITGGGGLIGGSLAKSLLEQGYAVTVLDIAPMESGSLPVLGAAHHPELTYVQASILDEAAWSRLPEDFQYMIHAAAILGIERVPREQIETMDVSIIGTRMCLDFARRLEGLRRFLYLSTSEVYGASAHDMDEQRPATIRTDNGRWCYASAKLSAEFYVKAFAERFALPWVIVRPFNVYGPAPTSSVALTAIVKRAVMNEPISVSGTGEQTRSWCHVQDFTKGLIECLFRDAARNETFNLGHDQTETTIIGLAETIREVTRSLSPIIVRNDTGADVFTRRPDLRKARDLLDFQPSTGVREGIEDVARWAGSISSGRLASA
jgi:nucleoside-diphosphate-sugar epimerase